MSVSKDIYYGLCLAELWVYVRWDAHLHPEPPESDIAWKDYDTNKTQIKQTLLQSYLDRMINEEKVIALQTSNEKKKTEDQSDDEDSMS